MIDMLAAHPALTAAGGATAVAAGGWAVGRWQARRRVASSLAERDRLTDAGIGIVAASAIVTSYSGLYGLFTLAGYGPLAVIGPGSVDAYAMTATRVWLSKTAPEPARRFAKWNAIGAIGLSVLGNIAYHWIAANLHGDLKKFDAAAWWPLVVAVASVPPIVLGLLIHLAHLRKTDPGPQTTRTSGPEQTGQTEPAESVTGAEDQTNAQTADTPVFLPVPVCGPARPDPAFVPTLRAEPVTDQTTDRSADQTPDPNADRTAEDETTAGQIGEQTQTGTAGDPDQTEDQTGDREADRPSGQRTDRAADRRQAGRGPGRQIKPPTRQTAQQTRPRRDPRSGREPANRRKEVKVSSAKLAQAREAARAIRAAGGKVTRASLRMAGVTGDNRLLGELVKRLADEGEEAA